MIVLPIFGNIQTNNFIFLSSGVHSRGYAHLIFFLLINVFLNFSILLECFVSITGFSRFLQRNRCILRRNQRNCCLLCYIRIPEKLASDLRIQSECR